MPIITVVMAQKKKKSHTVLLQLSIKRSRNGDVKSAFNIVAHVLKIN